MELGRFTAESEGALLSEGMPLATIDDVTERAALLGLFGQKRNLGSIEVLVRSRVSTGRGKEDVDAFEFSIPAENLDAFVEQFNSRESETRFGYLDQDEMDDFWVVHQDNFDEISITVVRE